MRTASYLRAAHSVIGSLWSNRALVWLLARRDVQDQHLGHAFGSLWVLLQPLFLMAVYVFVFTFVFATRIDDGSGTPLDYSVYVLAGLVPWLTLQQVLARSPRAIVGNAAVVKQISFPQEVLAVKTLYPAAQFMAITTAFLVVYMLFTMAGRLPMTLLLLPLLIALFWILAVGWALTLSCLAVFFRDIGEVIGLVLTVGIFILPILYRPGWLPPVLEIVITLNPFSPLVRCWQDAIFFGTIQHPLSWVANALLSVLVFLVGARLFSVAKPHFGDAL
jgi:lipopolysaccharide transport system permease protein